MALATSSILRDMANNRNHLVHLSNLRWIATDTLTITDTHYRPSCKGENLAFLQYTSGSTGNPKGVMVTHSNLLHNLTLLAKYFQLDQDSKILSWLPVFHDMGLIGKQLMALLLGIENGDSKFTCFC